MNDRRLSLILMAVMCISAMLVPVAVLVFVPERTVDKVIALPWTVIVPVVLPMLTASGAALWGFFTGPVTAPPERVAPSTTSLASDSTPTNPLPRRTKRDGFGSIDALLFIIALGCAAIAALTPGCGATARQVRLATIETTAVVVGTAAELVTIGATADAESCRQPVVSLEVPQLGPLDETCLASVELRWAPADTAIDGMRFLLGTWLAGEAFGGGEASFAETALRMLGLYADLVALLRPLHVELPPLVLGGAP